MTALCRRLDVTRAGFYAWRRRGESVHAAQDRTLAREITRLFALHHERYGSPRMYEVLRTTGWSVSRRQVARLMQQAGLRAKAVRGYRSKVNIHGLYTRHPNRLWATTVTHRDQVWVGDITYLKAGGTWRYLAIVMDQHSRRILAWSLSAQRSAAVTCAVLTRAARSRVAMGVIFHSDRGSEYMGAPFRLLLAQLGVLQSASVRGPGDNAHAESFFHTLKAELTRGVTYASHAELHQALHSYMRYYNTIRLHSALAYRSPLAFEQQAA